MAKIVGNFKERKEIFWNISGINITSAVITAALCMFVLHSCFTLKLIMCAVGCILHTIPIGAETWWYCKKSDCIGVY